jgi:hypothetical protein
VMVQDASVKLLPPMLPVMTPPVAVYTRAAVA